MKKLITILMIVGSSYFVMGQEVLINTDFIVETDGTVRLENDATVWNDLRVTLDKGKNAAKFTYFSGESGPQIWYFQDNDGDAMSFTVQLPHDWEEGTPIYPHIHWTPKEDGGSGESVEWNLDYTWVNYNATTPEVFPAIQTTTGVATGPFTAKTHLITDLTGGSGLTYPTGKISSILICRIWRGDDTYNSWAGGLFIDFHYQINTMGSRTPWTK